MDLETKELKNRVEAKQKQLEARLHELKADGAAGIRKEKEAIEARLSELRGLLDSGWQSISDRTKSRLNDWLSDDAKSKPN